MVTKKQKMVLDWIKDFIAEKGYSPSYQEIREGLGFKSLNTVAYHLRRLESQGALASPWGNRKRAIELPASPDAVMLMGEVRAGSPVESYEVPEQIEMPRGFMGAPEEHFALRVRGDSMVDEGIMDGDVIVVKKTAAAENSQVVVAMVDGESTVKRYRRKGKTIELIPANPAYQPIAAPEENVRIMGVVVALFRKY